MIREEAIKTIMSATVWTDEEREALGILIPELRESEDERIRKALIEVFKKKLERGFEWVEYGIPNRSVLSWLEKQKEPHFTKRNALFDKCVENCDPKIMKKVSDEVDEMLEKEQKPEEWSEEDEQWLESIIKDYEDSLVKDKDHAAVIKIKIDFLKSLRPQPHWKPSKEQMKALSAINCHGELSYVGQQSQLISLYNNLKKLM